ncbi:hypothetical protein [Pseudonocardia xishanensis]|uniref:Uncharacterized protein n=1 Tax=Pseudonocardia xishanensis TaxID=630995 RepID=A0ABP8RRC7_9PSEU
MSEPGSSARRCPHSDTLTGELKALAVAALDRLGPLLEAARSGEPAPSSCVSCPVCALLAVLRGERPELAVTLADHAAGVVAALRTLMEEVPERPAEGGSDVGTHAPPAGRRVQRIPVHRV